MEQVDYLKQKLSIKEFTPFQLAPLPALACFELILGTASLCLLASMLWGLNLPIYLGCGVFLPFALLGRKETLSLNHY